jgi:hypothetical protein
MDDRRRCFLVRVVVVVVIISFSISRYSGLPWSCSS